MLKNSILFVMFAGAFYLIMSNQWAIGLCALFIIGALSKHLTGRYWFGFDAIFRKD